MKNKYIMTLVTILTLWIAGCSNGTNNSSSSYVEETVETPPLATAMEIKANIDNDTIKLYWNFNEDVKSYVLEFGDKESGLSDHIALDTQVTSYTMTNLDEDHVYLFRLVSIFNDDTMSESNIIEVKTATTQQLVQNDTGPTL